MKRSDVLARSTRNARLRLTHLLIDRLTDRSPTEYATHVPVLVGLGAAFPIRSVLEFGAGHFSSGVFLDRRAFPDVERVRSIETDESWALAVASQFSTDDRFSIELFGRASEATPILDVEAFDLILIDDSTDYRDRSETIAAVAGRSPCAIVVIHDFEVVAYRAAARSLGRVMRFRAFNPQTGVYAPPGHSRSVARLRRLVEANRAVAPDDIAAWSAVFTNNVDRTAHSKGCAT